MSTMEKYFREHRTSARYNMGDRVRGLWNGIPFSGTVAVDHLVYEHIGNTVAVFLDLPIKVDGSVHTIISVQYNNIMDTGEKYDIKSKTNSKKSVLDTNRRSK